MLIHLLCFTLYTSPLFCQIKIEFPRKDDWVFLLDQGAPRTQLLKKSAWLLHLVTGRNSCDVARA